MHGAGVRARSDACKGIDAAPCSDLYRAPVPSRGVRSRGRLPATVRRSSPLARGGPAGRRSPPRRARPERTRHEVHGRLRPRHRRQGEGGCAPRAASGVHRSIGSIPAEDGTGCGVPSWPHPDAGEAGDQRRLDRVRLASCIAPLSFGSDPRRIMSLVEIEMTSCPDEDAEAADRIRAPTPGPRSTSPAPRAGSPGPGAGTGPRDRIRPGCERVERVPVLVPRADTERAVRDESLRPDWIGALGGLPSSPTRSMMPMIAGFELRVPARAGAHAQLARPACAAAHRDARSRRGGGLSTALPRAIRLHQQ